MQNIAKTFLVRFHNKNNPIEVLLLSLIGLIFILLSTTLPYAAYTPDRTRDRILGGYPFTWEHFQLGLVMISLIAVIELARYYELAKLMTSNEKWINTLLDILAVVLLCMVFLYLVIELYNVGLHNEAIFPTRGFYITFMGGMWYLIHGLIMFALSILINIIQKRFLNVITFIIGIYIFSWLYLWITHEIGSEFYYFPV